MKIKSRTVAGAYGRRRTRGSTESQAIRGTIESTMFPAIFSRAPPLYGVGEETDEFEVNVIFAPYAASDQPSHVSNSSPQLNAIAASSRVFPGRVRHTTSR